MTIRFSFYEILNAIIKSKKVKFQGLRILSHWMFELEFSIFELELKLRIETALATLSIPHKTMLVDSKVLQTVEQWSKGKQATKEIVTPSISPGPSSPKVR